STRVLRFDSLLQGPKEVENILLATFAQVIEVPDYSVRFGTEARMLLNCALQVRGPTVVQEKDALPQAPERRAAELPRTGLALTHAVRQPYTHVVDQQIGEEIDRFPVERGDRGIARRKRGRVAQRAPDLGELLPAVRDRRGSSGRIGRRLR